MGAYSFFEDNWYGLVDKLDHFIPVGKVVDKVDEKVPSFILFLAIIFIILILLISTLGPSFGVFGGSDAKYDVEVVVLTNSLPVLSAKISYFDCEGDDTVISTNASGVAKFSVCDESTNIMVTKTGYNSVSKDFESSDKRIIVSLSPQANDEKTFTLIVKNSSEELITDIDIELYCDSTLSKKESGQTESGFRFDFEYDCVFPQIKIKSIGYEEKNITILDDEERRIVYLEEVAKKGTVVFQTTNPGGVEANVEITLVDEFGKASTYFTDYSGNKDFEIDAGTYTYSAISQGSGEVKTGNFELAPGQRKTVNISFLMTEDQITASDKKYIAFKVLDENDKPLPFAKIRIYEGESLVTTRDSRSDGKTTPITKMLADQDKQYKGIITRDEYALVTFDIVLQDKDNFQEIKLQKGGAKINLSVVNDLLVAEKEAFVTLNIEGYNASIYNGETDVNGKIIFDYLSNGTYKLHAIDKTKKDEATLNVSLGKNETRDITLTLVTGEGKISFDFIDNEYDGIDTTFVFRNLDTDTIIKEGITTRETYRSADLKKGTNVNLVSNDLNYFYHQTLDYVISRTDQKKDVFLRTPSSLPNEQELQMFLMQIYDSNPLYGKVSDTSRIEPGNDYYIYFDLILNNEQTSSVLANFEIENDSNKGITIEDIYSINPSQRVLSSTIGDQIIDKQNNNFIVDDTALQGNLILSDQQGKKSIPVILKFHVDQNAVLESKSIINFNSIHGTNNSLDYSKEFIIGEQFCLDDCPVFLFNNYLKWEDREYEVLYEDVAKRMLIDDEYILKTTVTNKSDESIGSSKLVLTIPKEKIQYLTLEDNNTKSYDISLAPLSSSGTKETTIIPLKKTNVGTVFEKVSKEESGIDQLRGYVGNNTSVKFKIMEKEEIDISISPSEMSAGSKQFFFVIKTKYKSKYEGVPANWYVTKNGTRLGVGYEGQTDENGIQVLTINGSSFEEGDDIIFTAYDFDGAVDGTFTLEINDPFIEEEPIAPECISISFGGRDISDWEIPLKKLNEDAQTTLTFTSNCSIERRIYLHSDLLTTNNNFVLAPNSTEVIDVTAKPREGLLGVYPVQIISIDDSTYKTLGVVDIEISNPNSNFSLSEAAFNFRETDIQNATITNESFAGRRDNFNPQVILDTESVSVQFTKPGIPEIYDYNLVVRATAIESITLGGTKSEILYAHHDEHHSGDYTTARKTGTTAVINSDTQSRLCSSVTPEYEQVPKPEPDPPEKIRSAIPSFNPSEILPEEGNSNSVTEGELRSKKKRSLLFTTYPGGYIYNLINPASGLTGEFIFGALPLTYNSGPTADENSTTKIIGSAPYARNSGPVGKVTYFWHPKYMDSFGSSTPNPLDSSEVPEMAEQLFGERCDKYKAGDEYWRLTPFGNLNDTDKTTWKIATRSEYGVVNLGGIINPDTYLSELTADDVNTQFVATGAHAQALNKGPVYFDITVNGDCPTIGNCDDGRLKVQIDLDMAIEFLASIDEETVVPISIVPIEDTVYRVGSYRDFSLTPRWTNVDTQFGDYDAGDTFTRGNQLFTVGCITPNGIVSWEYAATHGHQHADSCNGMPIRPLVMDANDPLVEYDAGGDIRYWVHPEDIPDDLEVYLYNGNLYAEYVGVSEVAGKDIDLTLTKNNLVGKEYAIINVKDWVRTSPGQLEKKTQAFQVKLIGNTHNVFASDGTRGVTGEEFVPKLLFNWDWNAVSSVQCDSENYNYTYCDGVQFNISLMKRLYEIETLLLNNQLQNIPAKTAFYSYLVKDNYNTNLLNDFLEHYNSSFLDTGTIFAKLKKYIEEDKLKFKVNYENNTLLPYGGLYRVELEINRTNENLYSLFNGPQLNSEIVVNLVPIRRANNYNPFYELPFDGEVGDARNGYGVGGTSNLKLREGVNAKNASTALKQINYLTSTNPAVTDTGIVLDYDISTNEFVFVPSQPTPVEITVTRNNNSNAQLRYEVNGFSATTLPAKTWKLRTSTIGDTKCHDFENQDKQTFIESKSGAIHRVTWNKLRNGTLGLTTTFFTPKALSEPINITPVNESTSVFNSYSIVKQNTSVFLKYYDNRGITSYDTINGLFDLIKDEKMAISLTPSRVKIFWNPQYLEELEEEVISNSGYSCD